MQDDKFFVVGQVLKPKGLDGQIKIKPFSQDLTQFLSLKSVYIDGEEIKIKKASVSNSFVFLLLENINSAEQAERLKNKSIAVKKNTAALADDEFYIADLLDCDFSSGDLSGKIVNIHQFGSADVFEIILNDGRQIMFPHLTALSLKFDKQLKRVSVDFDLLQKVVVFN
ncbi:MAG: ribosome maturation factor RimM [Firmicutes bacterium]|nr:ribosome maturation factor RimM [Bacillota bacterium]